MKKLTQCRFAAQITAILVLASVLLSGCPNDGTSRQAGSATSRSTPPTAAEDILAAKKIRAAYAVVEPAVIKNPNTGELSGIFVDTLKEIGRLLSVEIEFTEEVGWDAMIAGLNAGRYDIVCAQVWPNAKRSREADFTSPLYYIGIGAYVRYDDTRFDADLSALNSEEVRISMIDGSTADVIAERDFPKAKTVALPGLSDATQTYLEIVNKHADVTFTYASDAEAFIRNNPDSLKNLVPNKPLRVFPNTFMIDNDEMQFLNMLDTAIEELHNSGFIENTIRRYENVPGELFRVAPGYYKANVPTAQ